MKIGVLGLQGDIPEHERAIRAADPKVAVHRVRGVEDLEAVDALVMPGGESTTIAQHLATTGLARAIPRRVAEGMPVLATCAGLILLAREVERAPTRNPETLGLLDITVRRNDYGRQRDSFEAPVAVTGIEGGPFPGVFIRAPRILSHRGSAVPFAESPGEVVGVRSGNILGLTFHPELSEDPRIHRLFLSLIPFPHPNARRNTNRTKNSPPRTAASQ